MLTGSLQIKNGNYYAVLNLKVNGKRKPKWIPLHLPERGNKRQAEAMLHRLIAEYESLDEGTKVLVIRNGTVREGTKEADALFADYMNSWVEMIKPSVATATYNSYKSMIGARIDAHFRSLGVTLGGLTPTHLQDFYQLILDEGYTTNTVIHYHAVLHRALKNAVKKDIIDRNPADRIDKPKKNSFLATHYSEEEMMRLFDVTAGDPLELPIKLAAYYGLRRSEVLGLKWSAIDFEHKRLSIQHKVIETEVDGKCVIVGEDVLKTKSSIRTLPLLPVMEEALRSEKQKQDTLRTLLRSAYCKDYSEYVCVDSTGKLLRPNFVTEHFAFLVQKFHLRKLRFHDLRHTCSSLLLANGVPMKQIQAWLGHSTFSTTADIYAHLADSAQEETGDVAAHLYQRKPSDCEKRTESTAQ